MLSTVISHHLLCLSDKVEERADLGDYFWRAGHDQETEIRYFHQRLGENPEQTTAFHDRFKHTLGNVEQVSTGGDPPVHRYGQHC